MIWKSRKFWLMIADVSVSTATFFVTKFLAPEMQEIILFLIGVWQPVIISLIIGIAIEDGAEKRNPAYFIDPPVTDCGDDI